MDNVNNVNNSASASNKNILLACTGSVASIKLPLLIDKLFQKAKDSNIHIEVSTDIKLGTPV